MAEPLRVSSNQDRSWARDLPQPTRWTDPVAERVYRRLSRPGTITDLYLVEAHPRPPCTAHIPRPRNHTHGPNCRICADIIRVYGDSPHVIAYRLWDEPHGTENAQSYIARHIAHARQMLGGVPYHPEA